MQFWSGENAPLDVLRLRAVLMRHGVLGSPPPAFAPRAPGTLHMPCDLITDVLLPVPAAPPPAFAPRAPGTLLMPCDLITDVLLPAPAACLGWFWHLAQISNLPSAALVWVWSGVTGLGVTSVLFIVFRWRTTASCACCWLRSRRSTSGQTLC
jgi:hypothetical protein